MAREQFLKDFDLEFDKIGLNLNKKYSKFDEIRSLLKKTVRDEGNISKSWSRLDHDGDGIVCLPEFQEYVNDLTKEKVDESIAKDIFKALDVSGFGHIDKSEFALNIVSQMDEISTKNRRASLVVGSESKQQALLVTIVGMHTPSKLDLSEHLFSTRCQFGKAHPNERNEHFADVKNWSSHYSVPIHDRFSSEEDSMDVTLSVISHIGSRTKHGGYAALKVPMKAKTGVAFEGWVPLRRTKRKATPVTLPILDPVQKLLSYVDSKMDDPDTLDVMKVCDIPKDEIEEYTFLRVRTIYFDFEQLANREMDRIQVEQGLKVQKKRVEIMERRHVEFLSTLREACHKIIHDASDKIDEHVDVNGTLKSDLQQLRDKSESERVRFQTEIRDMKEETERLKRELERLMVKSREDMNRAKRENDELRKEKDERVKQIREEMKNSSSHVSSLNQTPPVSPISYSSPSSRHGDSQNSDFMLQQLLQIQNKMDISEKFNLIRRDLDMIRHDIDSSRHDVSRQQQSLIGSSSDEVASKDVVSRLDVGTQTVAISIRSISTQTVVTDSREVVRSTKKVSNDGLESKKSNTTQVPTQKSMESNATQVSKFVANQVSKLVQSKVLNATKVMNSPQVRENRDMSTQTVHDMSTQTVENMSSAQTHQKTHQNTSTQSDFPFEEEEKTPIKSNTLIELRDTLSLSDHKNEKHRRRVENLIHMLQREKDRNQAIFIAATQREKEMILHVQREAKTIEVLRSQVSNLENDRHTAEDRLEITKHQIFEMRRKYEARLDVLNQTLNRDQNQLRVLKSEMRLIVERANTEKVTIKGEFLKRIDELVEEVVSLRNKLKTQSMVFSSNEEKIRALEQQDSLNEEKLQRTKEKLIAGFNIERKRYRDNLTRLETSESALRNKISENEILISQLNNKIGGTVTKAERNVDKNTSFPGKKSTKNISTTDEIMKETKQVSVSDDQDNIVSRSIEKRASIQRLWRVFCNYALKHRGQQDSDGINVSMAAWSSFISDCKIYHVLESQQDDKISMDESRDIYLTCTMNNSPQVRGI